MKKADHADAQNAGARKGPKLERLLSAAAGLMAEGGYAQTTIRDVARETGYSLAGMYYYFENKEDLLFQIQHRTFASLLAEQEAAAAEGGAPDEILQRLVENHLAYFTRHASELKVCTFEMGSLEPERYAAIAELRKRYFKCVAGVVGGIMGETNTDSGAVRRYTLLIFGMLNWIFMWYDPTRDGEVETLGDEMITMIRDGLPAAE